MFFAPIVRRASPSFTSAYANSLAASRWLAEAALSSPACGPRVEQDDSAYTLSFDLPGIAKDQLSIGIEGSVVRLATKPDAPRSYQAAYELPHDLDVATSEAKLEHGVLTLKLGKKVAVSNAAELTVH